MGDTLVNNPVVYGGRTRSNIKSHTLIQIHISKKTTHTHTEKDSKCQLLVNNAQTEKRAK